MSTKSITPIRSKWTGAMSDRDRFNRQMHYQSFDRTFNMEFGYWQENYQEWDIFLQNDIKTEDEANIFFQFDRIDCMHTNSFLYPYFKTEVVEKRGKNKIIRNHDGLLAEVPDDGHDTIPHFLESSIVTPEDWKRVKEERFRLDDPGRYPDLAPLKAKYPDDRDFPLGIGTGSMIGRIRDILTFEGVCYAIYDYPEMVEDMVETTCQLAEKQLDYYLPHFKFDYAFGWEDICFKNGPIVSVDFFKNVIVPRYKRLHKKLQAHGIDIWYTDCDGDVRPILPLFLESGINCLFPFEVNGCAHPSELLDAYEGELRIMGGVNKIELGKGKAEIKAYLESLEKYVAKGGYIPFCDHRCPPNVSTENYLYYLDLKERMFGLKA